MVKGGDAFSKARIARSLVAHNNSFHDLMNWPPLDGDFVDSLDQREGIQNPSRFKNRVHLLDSQRALEFLAIEKFSFDLLPLLFAFGLVGADESMVGRERVFNPLVVQDLSFMMVHAFASESFGASTITASVASGYEVSHATTLGKSVVLDAIKEHAAKLGHLTKTYSKQSRLGVATQANAVDKSRAESNHVFQSSANFCSRYIIDMLHTE
jgi:hypothetical protein